MKKCPQCNQFFADENLFCLNDGTPLINPNTAEHQTYTSETETIVVPRFNTPQTNQPAGAAGGNKWIFPVLGLLVGIILLLVTVLGYLAFSGRQSGDGENKNENKNVNVGTVNDNSTKENSNAEKKPTETPTMTPTPTPKKTAEPLIESTPVAPKSYGTTRISFARGAVSSTVSGGIDGGGKRTFVLAARSGQYLSASVSSSNGCVVFSGESTSTGFTTGRGDNYLYLDNSCGETNFSLTVSIR